MQVTLNIYDLAQQSQRPWFGLYHTGVEICGVEFSYASGAGIYECAPKCADGAIFRESIDLGNTSMSMTQIRAAIYGLAESEDFKDAVCKVLLNKSIPARINRLARWGKYVSCLLPAAIKNGEAGGPGSTSENAALLHHQEKRFASFSGEGRKLVAAASDAHTASTSGSVDEAERRAVERERRLKAMGLAIE